MSILSAIKQQSNSINDLAKLPQTMIMQMAQRKEIVPEMVPVILAKKAEMIDRFAKAKAAEGGTPQQSIMEQVMAQNAQAENPQTMGQMPPPMPQQNQMAQRPPMPQQPQGPADVGIATNPVPPMQMAGGGIIAFASGSQVKADPRQDFKTMLEEKLRQDLTGPEVDPYAGSRALAQQYGEEMKSRKGQDLNMALANMGAGMAASESPFFFTNVGRGAQEGIKSIAASNAQNLGDRRLLLSQAVEAEKSADARKTAKTNALTGALSGLYNKDLAAEIARSNASTGNAFKEQALLNNAYGILERSTNEISKQLFKDNAAKYNFDANSTDLINDAREKALERMQLIPGMRDLLKIPSAAPTGKVDTGAKTDVKMDKVLGSASNPLPMTSKDPKDYIKGKFYNTAQGPREWVGNGFR
jgi:hypothetical protein